MTMPRVHTEPKRRLTKLKAMPKNKPAPGFTYEPDPKSLVNKHDKLVAAGVVVVLVVVVLAVYFFG